MEHPIIQFCESVTVSVTVTVQDAYASRTKSCVVEILANTHMESNGQGWGAWSSLVKMC